MAFGVGGCVDAWLLPANGIGYGIWGTGIFPPIFPMLLIQDSDTWQPKDVDSWYEYWYE